MRRALQERLGVVLVRESQCASVALGGTQRRYAGAAARMGCRVLITHLANQLRHLLAADGHRARLRQLLRQAARAADEIHHSLLVIGQLGRLWVRVRVRVFSVGAISWFVLSAG